MNRKHPIVPKEEAPSTVEAEAQFVDAARRQSSRAAASADEAEVMRWIEDVRSVEGSE
ncbi:MAG: hypothetical protein ABR956_05135 [Terracidiphilus sp.]|jgi:hypothetical protein